MSSQKGRAIPKFLTKGGFAPILTILLLVVTLVGFILVREYNKSRLGDITFNTSVLPPSSNPTDQTANWKTYTNPQYKYSIKYPSDWSSYNNDGDFYNDEYFSDINVPRDLHQRITVRIIKYVGPKWKNTKEYFDELYQKNHKINIIGLPAVKETVEPKVGSGTYYAINILIYKNGLVYQLSNSSIDKETVAKYYPIFNQILSTFKFSD